MRSNFAYVSHCSGLMLLSICNIAQAEEVGDIYGGMSYSQTIAKDESSRNLGTYKPTTFGIGLSVVALRNLALDGYVFASARSSTHVIAPISTMTVSAQEGYGFNLRPYLSLNNSWGIYAKLGRQYGGQETWVRRGALQTTSSATYARTVYGTGVSYNLDDRWGISADYTKAKQISPETTKTALISLGLRYKF